MFQRTPIFTGPDRVRLQRLIADPAARYARPTFVEALDRKLRAGRTVEPAAVPRDVVTMHSLVRLRGGRDDATRVFVLVYPDEADLRFGRLSVLTQVGTAILGARAGTMLRWPDRDRRPDVRIERVIAQPEALARDGRRKGKAPGNTRFPGAFSGEGEIHPGDRTPRP